MRTLTALLLFGACVSSTIPEAAVQIHESPVEVTLDATDTEFRWTVRNNGPDELWAFLLVPEISGGRVVVSETAVWSKMEGDVLVLQKTQADVPEELDTDPMNSGAVRLPAGGSLAGVVPVERPVSERVPYHNSPPVAVSPRWAQLELGWVSPQRAPKEIASRGLRFAFIPLSTVDGGQRLTRSQRIPWPSPASP